VREYVPFRSVPVGWKPAIYVRGDRRIPPLKPTRPCRCEDQGSLNGCVDLTANPAASGSPAGDSPQCQLYRGQATSAGTDQAQCPICNAPPMAAERSPRGGKRPRLSGQQVYMLTRV
jgi:hypothetical protein